VNRRTVPEKYVSLCLRVGAHIEDFVDGARAARRALVTDPGLRFITLLIGHGRSSCPHDKDSSHGRLETSLPTEIPRGMVGWVGSSLLSGRRQRCGHDELPIQCQSANQRPGNITRSGFTRVWDCWLYRRPAQQSPRRTDGRERLMGWTSNTSTGSASRRSGAVLPLGDVRVVERGFDEGLRSMPRRPEGRARGALFLGPGTNAGNSHRRKAGTV
jgi:hypothetical protein